MSQENNLLKNTLKEITQPFKDLLHTSRALFGLNLSYMLEGLTYFGIVGLLAIYFNEYIGLDDIRAGNMVGFLTAGITLSMLFLGATVDWIGLRKSLLIALSAMLVGRIILTVSPTVGEPGLWGSAHILSMVGILGIIIGYGIYQPACYAGVKKLTDEKTAAMGYAMLYALMNLGGFLPGLISPPVRKAYGILGVFWVYVALTVVGIFIVYFVITKNAYEKAVAEASQNKNEEEEDDDELKNMTFKEKVQFYVKNFPLRDFRFLYFIFILIPVQTLFAHNWLTLPLYTSRAFEGFVQDNFEFFVNLNPILIFILTPMVAALTTKRNTYNMMIIGTFVMAFPTFILALGPNINTLMIYLIIMTIGEAMWQPRFLQWVAEIAPKNMTGIYMGIGQFPWFLTKIVTSLYSGWFLMKYCPADTPHSQMNTETMWFIYGLIAILSPLGLLLAKKWMMKGFKVKHEG
ncbi:major facilitator superfamily MFS_1 [Melioribacter roseus P3M-2]|uniref:Major facilitator superfamily MFS_1 n=1 Tax=Melioribacter roseus (strain DSM 23840 / JCM 17771 / VKM B-2668 / P3M-2) TaxID=1191523 RepID=I6Z292_MELRP|nr:MFS transporter [Melioribacter roseus]AFN73265.1 major facilitator superfamily MFS_1 [Melioribacter roseus P3M-2]